MTPKFFTAWEVYTNGISNLIARSGLDKDADVWQYQDGSYAVGDSVEIYEVDPDTDLDGYTHAGTVSEYLD